MDPINSTFKRKLHHQAQSFDAAVPGTDHLDAIGRPAQIVETQLQSADNDFVREISRHAAPSPTTYTIKTSSNSPDMHLKAVLKEVDRICSEQMNPIIRYRVRAELEKGIEKMMSDIKSSSDPASRLGLVHRMREVSLRLRPRRRVIASSWQRISTVLGTFLFSMKKYDCYCQTLPNSNTLSQSEVRITTETETSFQLVPSWWLVKCRLGASLGAQVVKSTANTLKFTLYTFNPVPNDSLIFEFCKNGNVTGIRDLLTGGLASVRDVDSVGTPLHWTADYCQPGACRLLLEQGADRDKKDIDWWQNTPFNRASYPAVYTKDDAQIQPHQTKAQIKTLRVFISAGMDIEDAVADQAMRVAGFYERRLVLSDVYFESPTFWMLQQLLPSVKENTYIYDSDWWYHKLYEAVNSVPGGETMQEVVKHCDVSVIQRTLILWVSVFDFPNVGNDHDIERCSKAMKLMLDRIPSLHFFEEVTGVDELAEWTTRSRCRRKIISTPTVTAMKRSRALKFFVSILRNLGIDTKEHIRRELELNADGWTEETLTTLFEDDFSPDYERCKPLWCKHCKFQSHVTWEMEPLWDQRKARIKEGRDPSDPQSESELSIQLNWEQYVNAYVYDEMCGDCQAKAKAELEDEEGFSPFLVHQ